MPSISANPAVRALAIAQTVDAIIPAAGGTMSLFGVYQLTFPANAVCDPNDPQTQAGYAARDWDAPCVAATSDIVIQATAKYSNGKVYIDFQPALRFVPNAHVKLSTNILAPTIAQLNEMGEREGWMIIYSPAIDAPGVADALEDQDVRTVIEGNSGKVWRRIKHFSGYIIAWRDGTISPCDPNGGDPRCVWVDDES